MKRPVVDRYVRIFDIGSAAVVLVVNTRTSNQIEVMTSNATIDVGALCAGRNYTVEIEDGAFVGLEACGSSGPDVVGVQKGKWIFVVENSRKLIEFNVPLLNERDFLAFDTCSDAAALRCHSDAVCIDSCSGVICECKSGFQGNGKFCFDTNECLRSDDDCDVPERATCTNTAGSFTCTCRTGYTGDGKVCARSPVTRAPSSSGSPTARFPTTRRSTAEFTTSFMSSPPLPTVALVAFSTTPASASSTASVTEKTNYPTTTSPSLFLGISLGAVIGIASGAVLFALVTIAVVAVLCRRRRHLLVLKSRSCPRFAINPVALEMEQNI